MTKDNLWARTRERVFDIYADHDHITQQRAWFLTLYYAISFLTFGSLLVVLASASPESFKLVWMNVSFGLVSLLICIVIILKGKYSISANIGNIINIILFTLDIYTRYKSPWFFQGFYADAYFVPMMIAFATLFCERYMILLTAVWFVIVDVILFLTIKTRMSGDELKIMTNAFIDNVFVIILVCILSMLIMTIMKRSNRKLITSVKEVSESSIKLNELSSVLDKTSQDQAHGSSTQAAAMEETSSMLKEISGKARHTSASANTAEGLMKETSRIVNEAKENMNSLKTSMDEVDKASEETVRIVRNIDNIAFQTNLLALNAAVEAARAGEAGAGFAVVAGEVKNLAQKSLEASKNTQEIINRSLINTRNSSELVKLSSVTFLKLAEMAQKLESILENINMFSEEQTKGIEQIEAAVTEMDKVIQDNAALSEETAAVATELNTISETTSQFVDKLKHLVSG